MTTRNKFLEFELGFDALGLSPLDEKYICQIPVGAAILGGAGISGASSLIGGKKGSNAALSAARIQAQSAQAALGLQQGVYQQIQSNLQPFLDYGRGGIDAATNFLTGIFSQPTDPSLPSFSYPQFAGQPPAPFTFQPTMAQLEQTPGYQFTRAAALDAEQANLASMGRTGSASARGAATTAGNIAATTWPTVFNAQLQQYEAGLQGFQSDLSKYTTNFNTASSAYTSNVNALLASKNISMQDKQRILAGLTNRVGTGLSASSIGSNVGIQAANQLGATTQSIGTALASGQVGSANAQIAGLQGIGSAASTGAGQYAGYQGYQNLLMAQGLAGGGVPVFNSPVASAAINANVDALAQNPANIVA